MNLQESIRRILREESKLPLFIRRRFSEGDIDELISNVKFAIPLYGDDQNINDVIDDEVREFMMDKSDFGNGTLRISLTDTQYFDQLSQFEEPLRDYVRSVILNTNLQENIKKILHEEISLQSKLNELIETLGIWAASESVGGITTLGKILNLDFDDVDVQERLVRNFINFAEIEDLNVRKIEKRISQTGNLILRVYFETVEDGININSWYDRVITDEMNKFFPFKVKPSWGPAFAGSAKGAKIFIDSEKIKNDNLGNVISEQTTPVKLNPDGCQNGYYRDCNTKQCTPIPANTKIAYTQQEYDSIKKTFVDVTKYNEMYEKQVNQYFNNKWNDHLSKTGLRHNWISNQKYYTYIDINDFKRKLNKGEKIILVNPKIPKNKAVIDWINKLPTNDKKHYTEQFLKPVWNYLYPKTLHNSIKELLNYKPFDWGYNLVDLDNQEINILNLGKNNYLLKDWLKSKQGKLLSSLIDKVFLGYSGSINPSVLFLHFKTPPTLILACNETVTKGTTEPTPVVTTGTTEPTPQPPTTQPPTTQTEPTDDNYPSYQPHLPKRLIDYDPKGDILNPFDNKNRYGGFYTKLSKRMKEADNYYNGYYNDNDEYVQGEIQKAEQNKRRIKFLEPLTREDRQRQETYNKEYNEYLKSRNLTSNVVNEGRINSSLRRRFSQDLDDLEIKKIIRGVMGDMYLEDYVNYESFVDDVVMNVSDYLFDRNNLTISDGNNYFLHLELQDYLMDEYSRMIIKYYKENKEDDEDEDDELYENTELKERCWKGYTQKGMKTMFGKRYPNCVKNKK